MTIDRSRLVQSGRDQTCPQAASVISAWNGASKAVFAASARSTWASPSTPRRVFMPRAWRLSAWFGHGRSSCSLEEAPQAARRGLPAARRRGCARRRDDLEARAGDEVRPSSARASAASSRPGRRRARASGRRSGRRARYGRRRAPPRRSRHSPATGWRISMFAQPARSAVAPVRKAGVNQRSRMPSAIAAMPSLLDRGDALVPGGGGRRSCARCRRARARARAPGAWRRSAAR